MPAIAGIAAESTTDRGERSVGSYQTPGLNQLPPALAGMNELPAGFDPAALSFPGAAGGGSGGGGKKGNKKKRK
jgi:signal recognition particle subunit SRP54